MSDVGSPIKDEEYYIEGINFFYIIDEKKQLLVPYSCQQKSSVLTDAEANAIYVKLLNENESQIHLKMYFQSRI